MGIFFFLHFQNYMGMVLILGVFLFSSISCQVIAGVLELHLVDAKATTFPIEYFNTR